jgi:uncharacterized membrane protein
MVKVFLRAVVAGAVVFLLVSAVGLRFSWLASVNSPSQNDALDDFIPLAFQSGALVGSVALVLVFGFGVLLAGRQRRLKRDD